MSFDLEAAHSRSFRNRECIEKSIMAACFFCADGYYPAEDVVEFVREDCTALCPRCGIDAVIGDASGIPLTKEFLLAMHQHWFCKEKLKREGK